jgi:catechol 2,3-dioxygenase-like lactoylglutathione lyase family enzyme
MIYPYAIYCSENPLKLLNQTLSALLALSCVANTGAEPLPGFTIHGWSEVVMSVTDLEPHREYFSEVGGWDVLAEGSLAPETLAAWGLATEVSAQQLVMGNPGTERGHVRLVRFAGVPQQLIRSNARSWESGGILDINIRVTDMDRKQRQLQQRGWQAHSDPVQFTFGPFVVREWITLGPDGMSIALIQRLAPPLEGWPALREFSRTFNSTQVVRDLEAALGFYRDVLGFEQYLYHEGTSPAPGNNVLGLPWETAMAVERKIWIGHPEGLNEGSVELIEFKGASGRDLSALAKPPNLGLLMLRFPVDNLSALARHLESHGVPPLSGIRQVQLPPTGPARQVSVRAPDGAWLEFYEEIR